MHQRDRHVFEGARCRLGESAIERGAVSPGHDQAGGPKHTRRAQNGAHIVWVGDLIENQERPVRHLRGQAGQGRLRQRFRFNQSALMDRIVTQTAIEILWQDPLMHELAGGEAVLEPALGVAAKGDLANDPSGIGKRCLDGVDTKDEKGIIPLGVGASLSPAGVMAMPVVHGSRG